MSRIAMWLSGFNLVMGDESGGMTKRVRVRLSATRTVTKLRVRLSAISATGTLQQPGENAAPAAHYRGTGAASLCILNVVGYFFGRWWPSPIPPKVQFIRIDYVVLHWATKTKKWGVCIKNLVVIKFNWSQRGLIGCPELTCAARPRQRVTGEAFGIAYVREDMFRVRLGRQEEAEGEARGPNAANEVEALPPETRAGEEEVADGLGGPRTCNMGPIKLSIVPHAGLHGGIPNVEVNRLERQSLAKCSIEVFEVEAGKEHAALWQRLTEKALDANRLASSETRTAHVGRRPSEVLASTWDVPDAWLSD
ncbi:hypothetical protein B0H19DRAFT_1085778 [Mycena capillaripes]|nr:hypothetical protein B0H19DRAFT_1085778 [Mycena capillaripes]